MPEVQTMALPERRRTLLLQGEVRMTSSRRRGHALHAVLLVPVLVSTLSALGQSPFRLEGAYVYPNRVAVSGMADITRWLAVRLSLLSAYWSSDTSRRDFTLEGGSGFSAFEDVGLVVSPWRDRLRVQPYAFGGIGAKFADADLTSRGIELGFVELKGTYGIGVEPLLFFLPRAPSLFLELGQTFSGKKTTVFGLPQTDPYPWWWIQDLMPVTRIAAGIRL
jgi:hypothetical protein